jgi:hypothetical protein
VVTNNGVFNVPTQIPSLSNLDLTTLNKNYNPWGGNPYQYNSGHSDGTTGAGNDTNRYAYWLKDPGVTNSDAWNFSASPSSDFNWLGGVHRGTPWQTVYLKSFDVLNGFINGQGQLIWQQWSENPNRYDANNSAPLQDWYLAGLLTSLFSTNPIEQTISVNDTNIDAWRSILDGLVALTNSQTGTLDAIIVSSNLDQAMFIANSIQSTRASRSQGLFDNVGAILSVPAISVQSPFLNFSTAKNVPSDDAYETIPSQLLPLLRLDAHGTMALANKQPSVQFTGWSGHTYVIQTSSNLVDWVNVSTNYLLGGNFSYTNPPNAVRGSQFYRTQLQP